MWNIFDNLCGWNNAYLYARKGERTGNMGTVMCATHAWEEPRDGSALPSPVVHRLEGREVLLLPTGCISVVREPYHTTISRRCVWMNDTIVFYGAPLVPFIDRFSDAAPFIAVPSLGE